MDQYEDRIMEDHDYDGIQEYDNPMPAWWKNLFIVTVIWSVIYVAGQLLGYVPTYEEDFKAEVAEIQDRRYAHSLKSPPMVVDEQVLAAAIGDPDQIALGGKAYAPCVGCHGAQGQGGIGPNLTDEYWLYGGAHMDVFNVIQTGTSHGMPAWSDSVTREQTVALVAYLHSLQGTNPPDAREPQGERWVAERGDTSEKQEQVQ
jgi:cytochrome c oxidase cbb3-type subunit 3